MKKPPLSYPANQEHLVFFYRKIILQWELEWKNYKFIQSEGDLKIFCQNNRIDLKSFESIVKLNDAIETKYNIESRNYDGLLWFVKQETKPKDALKHLRNCFAHGNFKKIQKNKKDCIFITNKDNNKIKAQGFLTYEALNKLIDSIISCKVH